MNISNFGRTAGQLSLFQLDVFASLHGNALREDFLATLSNIYLRQHIYVAQGIVSKIQPH